MNLNNVKKFQEVSIDYDEYDLTFRKGNEDRITYNEIGQLISRARMLKRPLIVVEGIDDVKIYENISQIVGRNFEFRPVETIKGYDEGCTQVRKFIEDAQIKIKESRENIKYIRGIIDRDASIYRSEDYSHLKGLFILEAYSYECHFVTFKHVKFLLANLLKSSSIISDKIIDYVTSDLNEKYLEIYYLSLEALKNACVKNYNNVLGYDFTYGRIEKYQTSLYRQVIKKKEELDKFAEEKGLTFEKDLYKIVKGKWIMGVFIDSVYKKIKSLGTYCIDGHQEAVIPKCHYCDIGKKDNCLWNIKKSFRKETALNLVYEYIDEEETYYIQQEFAMLG